ncbi:Na+/H+ antiporter NhaA [Longispora albida]|uniref:Na+/H+ antiporter NhaA n=1 Tax=Longispora albida TaxID=203523 RepID=UPI00037B4DFE|nr:Na+/H+ antiporter NhaA [Longispora albida]
MSRRPEQKRSQRHQHAAVSPEAGRQAKLKRARRKLRKRASGAAGTVVRYLRIETIGGLLLVSATVLALILANSPLSGFYEDLRATRFGFDALHLNLSLENWAKDGLLTVFFVVAGLELKRELVVGELRDVRRALFPVFGALGGMVVPAALCLAIAWGAPGGTEAWAIPVATDIAFALAVLALTGSNLPSSLRVFLLSLAVVDDLGAILLIAVVYTASVSWWWLLAAVAALVAYGVLQQLRVRGLWLYIGLGVAAWAFLHSSGVHATIAGVAVGLLTRVKRDSHEEHAPAETLEHKLQPFSAGFCVPVFAFMAAGVALNAATMKAFTADRVAWAVVAGLVLGKTIGVLGGAAASHLLRLGKLPDELSWWDLVAVSVLAGCGFTVSLLIAELAFPGLEQAERMKTAVLLGSLIAALLAAGLLRLRTRIFLRA